MSAKKKVAVTGVSNRQERGRGRTVGKDEGGKGGIKKHKGREQRRRVHIKDENKITTTAAATGTALAIAIAPEGQKR